MKGNSHLDFTSLIQRMPVQRYKIQILINRLKIGNHVLFLDSLFLYYSFNSFLGVSRVGNAATSRGPSRCYQGMKPYGLINIMKQKHFVLSEVRTDAKKLLEMPSSSLPLWLCLPAELIQFFISLVATGCLA